MVSVLKSPYTFEDLGPARTNIANMCCGHEALEQLG